MARGLSGVEPLNPSMTSRPSTVGTSNFYSEVANELRLPTYLPTVDLQGVLARHDAKTLEFKRDLSSPRPIIQRRTASATPEH